MTEFVIVVPLLIILLFTIIQFGLVLNRVQSYNSAAREGARLASLPATDQGDIASAVDAALAGLNLGDTRAIATTPSLQRPCEGRNGQSVTVELTSPYTVQIPLLPDRDITLTGTGVFRCE